MAIIYSYPTVAPTVDDLVLGTDVNQTEKPTKNFTVQSLVDLVAGGVTGLGATIESNPSAKSAAGVNQSAIDFTDITGNGTLTFPGLISTTITNAGAITTASLTATGAISGLTLSGILTAGSSIAGLAGGTDGQNVLGVTQNVGDNSTRLATTAYVDSIVDPSILQYLGDATGPFDLSLVSDDFKIAGTANQIETTAATVTGNVGIVTLKFPTAGITLPDGSIATTQALTDTTTKVATTAFVHGKNDAQDLDFSGTAGTGSVLLNSQSLAVTGTALQITTAAAAQGLSIALTPDVTITGTYTGATFAGDFLGTVDTTTTGTTQAANNNSTLIATTAYADAGNDAQTFNYKDASATIYQLNLFADRLQLAGGSNITTVASAVNASDIADVTFNLDNTVTITGTMKADTFTTTAGTATWVTTVLAGFTSITSTSFVGALTGNASTASALLTTGTINMTSTAGATLGPTASAVTYTNGGNISLVSVLAASTVTSKLLTGISFSTGTNVAATDTILEGVGKLQKQITDLPAGLDYIGTWDASGGGGGVPDLTVAATHVPGQYYICSADSPAGGTFPNGGAVGPSEWKIGDWCIRGDAQNDVWQKIDNTAEVTTDGSGVSGTMPVWNNASELGSSQIQQIGVAGRTVTTIVDGGAGGDLTVQGNTLLGSASTDTVNSVGVHTIDEQLILKKGLGVGATPDYGDTTDKVLTSGNGSANPPAWTNRSTWGYVESVTEGTGITVSGTSIAPVINIDYVGTDNAILSATQYLGTDTLPDTCQIWFNDPNHAASNTVLYAPISDLPFDNYQHWILSDGTSTATITSTNTAKILGGTGITSVVSPTDKSATLSIDYVGADNAILSAGAGTPIATDELWFNNADVASGTVQRASIASIVDLGNETLAQVLVNGNVTGGTDIVVQENITFSDANGTNQGNIIMGTGSDMSMGYDGDYGLELVSAAGALSGGIRMDSPLIQLRDLTSPNKKLYFQGTSNAAVNLYYDGSKKFETTSTGVEIGSGDVAVPPNLVLTDNGTNNLTLTFGNNGGPQIIHNKSSGVSSMTLRNDGTIFLMNTTNSDSKAVFGVDIDLSPQNQAGSIVSGVRISQSTNAIAEGTKTRIFGDLQTDRSIIHGSTGASAGVVNIAGQGGTFTKLFTSVSGGSIAFTIDRPESGAMVFDVMMTSDTSATCSVAKKYTVVKQYSEDPIVYKILDTGPDGTVDFTPVFTQPSSIEPTKIQCVITPVNTVLQKIGITIDLGFGKNNATVVMNT